MFRGICGGVISLAGVGRGLSDTGATPHVDDEGGTGAGGGSGGCGGLGFGKVTVSGTNLLPVGSVGMKSPCPQRSSGG